MNSIPVNEAIERYVQECRERGSNAAGNRFLSYAHLRYHGGELTEFLSMTSKMIQYNISLIRVMVNPLKAPEFAFLITAVAVAVFGCLMLNEPEEQLPGIFILSGALVNGISIFSRMIRKWCDLNVMIAIYRQLLALTEKELLSCNGQSVAVAGH